MAADISVIIPTYRRPNELAEAIESVLSQRETSLEIIVVDDAPDQSAREAVLRFSDPRIRYEPNPVPSGGFASAVRNYGLTFASAPLVHFLDDDDKAPPDHYAHMKASFEANPNIGVIFGCVRPFGENAEKVRHEETVFASAAQRAMASRYFGSRWAFSSRLFFSPTLLVCGAAMIRRSCAVALGGFDPTLRVAEDVDFYARAIQTFGARFVDRVTLLYRIWDNSLMHTQTLDPNLVRDCYRKMQARYRTEHGTFNYFFNKVLTRTLLRLI
jgi:glycosyltransferase involved in cell wall biosynthesis